MLGRTGNQRQVLGGAVALVTVTVLLALALLLAACPEKTSTSDAALATGACEPMQERIDTQYVQVGAATTPMTPAGPDYLSSWQVGATRPDCPSDVDVTLELGPGTHATELPTGLFTASVDVACTHEPGRSVTYPMTLVGVGHTSLFGTVHVDAAPPCADGEHRDLAEALGQPFSPVTLHVLAKPDPAVAGALKAPLVLVGTTKFRYVPFETWRASAKEDAGADADAGRSVVRIASPANAATVGTPVTFVVTASWDVAKVELWSSKFLLKALDPATTTTFAYPFNTLGKRDVRALGFDANGKQVAEHAIEIFVVQELKLNHTFYWVALEKTAGTDKTLYTKECSALQHGGADLKVGNTFFDSLCMEGTGRLLDGTTINVTDNDCACAAEPLCPAVKGVARRKCWRILEATKPWGEGSSNNPLIPLVSWATDPTLIPGGTVLYAKAWDGWTVTGVDGASHQLDGCFRADDVGDMITATHVDFFAGTPAVHQQLEAIHPTNHEDWMWVQLNPPRCHPPAAP